MFFFKGSIFNSGIVTEKKEIENSEKELKLNFEIERQQEIKERIEKNTSNWTLDSRMPYSLKKDVYNYENLSDDVKERTDPNIKYDIAKTYHKYAFTNKDEMIKSVEIFKGLITDDISIGKRVNVYNRLGNFYCNSARDLDIANAMYEDNPFLKNILDNADGNYSVAGKDIYEMGYDLKPTVVGANMASHWYAKRILEGNDIEKHPKYVEKIISYMDFYENANSEKDLRDKNGYWASMSYAALCKAGKSEYCQKYRDLIEKEVKSNQYSIWVKLFDSYYYLNVENNKELASETLQKHMKTQDFYKERVFPVFWKNESQNPSHDLMYNAITEMAEITPEFKEYLEYIN